MQPEERIRQIIEAGEVLGDSVRLAVTLYLSVRGKARFTEVAEGLDLSPGRLAHHLKTLEEAGYIRVQRPWEDLRTRVLILTPEGIHALRDFLFRLREVGGF
ncbi:MAG: ArsR/SmtB family transcription factor [Thermoproteota archaeon]